VSKEHRNRQQFIDEVFAPFGARFAAGERSVPCGSTRMATP